MSFRYYLSSIQIERPLNKWTHVQKVVCKQLFHIIILGWILLWQRCPFISSYYGYIFSNICAAIVLSAGFEFLEM